MYTAILSSGHLTINLKDNVVADLGSFHYFRIAAVLGLTFLNLISCLDNFLVSIYTFFFFSVTQKSSSVLVLYYAILSKY